MSVMTLKMSCLKQLADCIDVKIVGHQNINEENIDFKGFVAGYLGQIVKSEAFQSLTTEIRERVGHVYFLVNLMCRFDDFQLVLKEYTFVQESLQNGTVTWEDSEYFRIWERQICSEIGLEVDTKDIIQKEESSKIDISEEDVEKTYKFATVCNNCNFESSSENEMKRHKLEKHGEKVQCGDCDKPFATFRAYKVHIRTHVARKCQVCEKSVLKASYKAHLTTHKDNRGKICTTCGKSVINMFNHAQTHKNKDFSCRHCDFKSNVEHNLNLHIQRKHSKVDPVQCPQCGKMIKARSKNDTSRLKLHISRCSANSSNREKHHVCHLCQKKYIDKHGLNGHMKHAHDKSFQKIKCDKCDYQSSSRNNVFMHTKRVHEGRPLREECQYCKRKVIVMSTHISRYHGELTVIQDPNDLKL